MTNQIEPQWPNKANDINNKSTGNIVPSSSTNNIFPAHPPKTTKTNNGVKNGLKKSIDEVENQSDVEKEFNKQYDALKITEEKDALTKQTLAEDIAQSERQIEKDEKDPEKTEQEIEDKKQELAKKKLLFDSEYPKESKSFLEKAKQSSAFLGKHITDGMESVNDHHDSEKSTAEGQAALKSEEWDPHPLDISGFQNIAHSSQSLHRPVKKPQKNNNRPELNPVNKSEQERMAEKIRSLAGKNQADAKKENDSIDNKNKEIEDKTDEKLKKKIEEEDKEKDRIIDEYYAKAKEISEQQIDVAAKNSQDELMKQLDAIHKLGNETAAKLKDSDEKYHPSVHKTNNKPEFEVPEFRYHEHCENLKNSPDRIKANKLLTESFGKGGKDKHANKKNPSMEFEPSKYYDNIAKITRLQPQDIKKAMRKSAESHKTIDGMHFAEVPVFLNADLSRRDASTIEDIPKAHIGQFKYPKMQELTLKNNTKQIEEALADIDKQLEISKVYMDKNEIKHFVLEAPGIFAAKDEKTKNYINKKIAEKIDATFDKDHQCYFNQGYGAVQFVEAANKAGEKVLIPMLGDEKNTNIGGGFRNGGPNSANPKEENITHATLGANMVFDSGVKQKIAEKEIGMRIVGSQITPARRTPQNPSSVKHRLKT